MMFYNIYFLASCDWIKYLIQPAVQMIKGILIINNHGKPRLVKFYQSVVRIIQVSFSYVYVCVVEVVSNYG